MSKKTRSDKPPNRAIAEAGVLAEANQVGKVDVADKLCIERVHRHPLDPCLTIAVQVSDLTFHSTIKEYAKPFGHGEDVAHEDVFEQVVALSVVSQAREPGVVIGIQGQPLLDAIALRLAQGDFGLAGDDLFGLQGYRPWADVQLGITEVHEPTKQLYALPHAEYRRFGCDALVLYEGIVVPKVVVDMIVQKHVTFARQGIQHSAAELRNLIEAQQGGEGYM